jgi:hypothetical protein
MLAERLLAVAIFNSVRYDLRAAEVVSGGDIACWRDVEYDGVAQCAPKKCQKEQSQALPGGFILPIASKAFSIVMQLEMSGTSRAARMMKEQSVRTNGLVAMMFDHHRLAGQAGEQQR